jgi:predicted nicotinamide N-methyase
MNSQRIAFLFHPARNTIVRRDNIDFICANLLDAEIPECDVITIVDVFYLLPRKEQHRLLVECRRKLRAGGLLVWKSQERRPRWKYALTYLQEFISTSAGFTVTHGPPSLEFMSREEAISALKTAGFRTEIIEVKNRGPYSDIIYLGREIE